MRNDTAAPMSFGRFVASLNLGVLSAHIEAERRALWNSRTIRKEGREPELRDIRELYDRLQQIHGQSVFADAECRERLAVMVTAEVFRSTGAPADNDSLITNIGNSARSLLREEVFFGFPRLDWSVPLDLEDGVALRNYLERKRHFLLYAESILDVWGAAFVGMWAALFTHLPDRMFLPEENRSGTLSLRAPLLTLIEKPADAVERLLGTFTTAPIEQHHLFETLIAAAEDNLFRVSGIPFEDRA
ncbi:MAG: hypothetical protein AAGJ70_13325, partial [Pseudomonadota bacterium]